MLDRVTNSSQGAPRGWGHLLSSRAHRRPRCCAYSVALMVLSVQAALAAPAHAQFNLYDAFAGGFIDPDLWEGISTEGSFAAPTAEMIRVIENSALHLKLVSYGNDTSNTGSTLSYLGLQFKNLDTLGGSGSIIGIKAK